MMRTVIVFLLVLMLTLALLLFMQLVCDSVFGLYRHYKGGYYLGLFRTLSSDNRDSPMSPHTLRRSRVIYLSLRHFELDDRDAGEFFTTASMGPGYELSLRFTRILPWWQPRPARPGQ